MDGFDRLKDQLVDAVRSRLAGDRHRLPEAGVDLWNAFCDLAASRTYHHAGPNPISYRDIAAWASLHRWPIEPRHVAIIRAMDEAWMEAVAARIAGKDKAGSGGPQGALSPQLFDAVF